MNTFGSPRGLEGCAFIHCYRHRFGGSQARVSRSGGLVAAFEYFESFLDLLQGLPDDSPSLVSSGAYPEKNDRRAYLQVRTFPRIFPHPFALIGHASP